MQKNKNKILLSFLMRRYHRNLGYEALVLMWPKERWNKEYNAHKNRKLFSARTQAGGGWRLCPSKTRFAIQIPLWTTYDPAPSPSVLKNYSKILMKGAVTLAIYEWRFTIERCLPDFFNTNNWTGKTNWDVKYFYYGFLFKDISKDSWMSSKIPRPRTLNTHIFQFLKSLQKKSFSKITFKPCKQKKWRKKMSVSWEGGIQYTILGYNYDTNSFSFYPNSQCPMPRITCWN